MDQAEGQTQDLPRDTPWMPENGSARPLGNLRLSRVRGLQSSAIYGAESRPRRKAKTMLTDQLAMMLPMAAAGWAFLVYLFGGGLGLAVLVFIVLKVLGK